MLVGSLSFLCSSVTHKSRIALFSSKEGAAQVKLKISLVGDDAGHNFTFTSPQPQAVNERQKFKQELTAIIGRNRSAPDNLPKPILPSINPSNGLPAHIAPSPVASTPRPSALSVRPSMSRAPSVASESRGTPVVTGSDPASEFRLRKKVLMSNPELGALHRDLVMTGQITEAEFWDGREVCRAAFSSVFF